MKTWIRTTLAISAVVFLLAACSEEGDRTGGSSRSGAAGTYSAPTTGQGSGTSIPAPAPRPSATPGAPSGG